MRFVHLLLFFILFQNILLADITSEIKQIKQLESQIQNINNFLNNPNNLWIKKYSNYKSYQQISFNISKAQEEIQKLQNLPKTIENQTQLNNLQRNLIVLQNQINLLGNYKDTPFIELIEPKKLEEAPNVTNALLIINALSYLKKNNEELKILQRNYENLQNNLDKLQQKEKFLQELLNLYQNSNNKNKLSQICNTDYCLFNSTEAISQELKY